METKIEVPPKSKLLSFSRTAPRFLVDKILLSFVKLEENIDQKYNAMVDALAL